MAGPKVRHSLHLTSIGPIDRTIYSFRGLWMRFCPNWMATLNLAVDSIIGVVVRIVMFLIPVPSTIDSILF
jgi:hypothetical protein